MKKKYVGLFVYAVLAGFCIGLGGTVYLRVKDAFPGGTIAGAALFTVGLFTICTRGYALFTGRVSALFDHSPSYLLELLLIWIGNFTGTALLALIESGTSLCGGGIDATAADLVAGKMSSGLGSLFLLGLICNVLIYIAVNGYANHPHPGGKYLSLFFGVMVFILSGTEHSIADMYYWCVSGVLAAQPGESILRILIVTLGNAAGGLLLPLSERLYRFCTK